VPTPSSTTDNQVEKFESDSDESVGVDEVEDPFLFKPVMTSFCKKSEGLIKVWGLDGEYVSK